MAENGRRFAPADWWQSLSREQQVSVGVLAFCGILTLGLSLMQLRSHLTSPFLVPKSILQQSSAILAQQQDDAKQLEELKKKDTDHDGLSDYAELYIYHTSPYLADTDGDGIPDSVEVAMGTDPNCPEGKVCQDYSTAVVQGNASTTNADFLNVTKVAKPAPEVILGSSATSVSGAQSFLDNPPPPGSMTPEQIRAYLVAHGLVQASQVSQLPDDMVNQVYAAAYEEALRVQAASQSPGAASSSNASNP